MITIPALVLLGIFALIGAIFVIMMAANLYHGYRFGRNDPMTMTVNSAFVVAMVTIVVLTVLFLAPVDWSQKYTVSLSGINVQTPNSLDVNQ